MLINFLINLQSNFLFHNKICKDFFHIVRTRKKKSLVFDTKILFFCYNKIKNNTKIKRQTVDDDTVIVNNNDSQSPLSYGRGLLREERG